MNSWQWGLAGRTRCTDFPQLSIEQFPHTALKRKNNSLCRLQQRRLSGASLFRNQRQRVSLRRTKVRQTRCFISRFTDFQIRIYASHEMWRCNHVIEWWAVARREMFCENYNRSFWVQLSTEPDKGPNPSSRPWSHWWPRPDLTTADESRRNRRAEYSQAPQTRPSVSTARTHFSTSCMSVSSSQGFTSRTMFDFATTVGSDETNEQQRR